MTKDELNAIGIVDWKLIQSNYDYPDILIGNGFSIQQNENFRYTSIFEKFISKCPAQYVATFKLFGESNFELILEHLSYARRINESLGGNAAEISKCIELLKTG